MNIVYLAPFWDGTGYAHIAQQTVMSLCDAGFNVIPRSIKLTGQVVEPLKIIQHLETKDIPKQVDLVIQNSLPPLFTKTPYRTAGYFFTETDNISNSVWPLYAKLMDETWSCCPNNSSAFIDAGISNVKKVFGYYHPSFYPENNNSLQIPGINPDTYVFYFIGDFSYRKAVLELVEAYYKAFNSCHNVHLILKTYCDGKLPHESKAIIAREIDNLKQSLRLYNKPNLYPKVSIITDYLSNDGIRMLHNIGHCFVSVERGAAWNLPAFDAMALGKAVIVNGWGGQTQFVSGPGTYKTPYRMVGVKNMNACPYDGLYTANERWAEPCLESASKAMQAFYRESVKNIDRGDWKKKWRDEPIEQIIEVVDA